MRKKIIAVLCALTLIPFAAFAASSAESDTDITAIQHVQNLGFMESDSNGNFKSDYIVTRGELAHILCRVVNAGFKSSGVLSYTDVKVSDKYYDEILYCSEFGILNGHGDGTFMPDDPASVIEAVKAYVSLLGYDVPAYTDGGYPAGYLKAAKEISLIKNMNVSDYYSNITRGQLAVLTVNALRTPMYEIGEFSGENVTYRSTDTLMYKFHDLLYTQGIVEANEHITIADRDTAEQNAIVVNGVEYRLSNPNDKRLIGKYVEVFYTEDSLQAVSVAEAAGKNSELILRDDEFVSASGTQIKYSVQDIERTAAVSGNAKYFYNYNYVLDYNLNNVLQMKSPEIILIDNNDDGRYELVFVNDYQTVVVGAISSDDKITDKFNASVVLDLDDSGEKDIDILDEDGREIGCSDIDKNNVLSVLNCTDFIMVYVSSNQIKGTLDTVNDDNYVISGKEYPISKEIKSEDKDSLGSNITAYPDYWGRIVFAVAENNDKDLCGYLRAANVTKQNLNPVYQLKIFTTSGENVIYKLSNKYQVDETAYNESDRLPEVLFKDGAAVGQLLHYSLDSDGSIKTIKTAKSSLAPYENGFFTSYSAPVSRYNANSACFDGKAYIDSKTVLMQVPDGADDEDCKIIQKSNISNVDYNIVAYNNSMDNQYADVVVFRDKALALNYDSGLAVFLELSTAVDDARNRTYAIEYFAKGERQSAYVGNDVLEIVSDFEKGDVFRYTSDKSDIVDVELVYEMGSGFKLSTSSDFGASYRAVHGYAAKADSRIVRVSPDKAIYNDSTPYSMEGYVLNNADITVVSLLNGNIYVRSGKIDDVMIGDELVITTRSGVSKYLVIIKRQ